MPKPEILPRAPSAAPLWIFDTCQLGVVLRAVLAVQLLLCLAAAYTSQSVEQWLLQAAWLTSGGLFGSLAWLLLTCAAKRWLQHHAVAVQLGLGIALGAGCSLASSAILAFTSDLPPPHWWANMLTGGILAAGIMGWLLLRSHARMPAAATAQLALLQAKIRPHFLFNSLNSAIALVATEPHKAEQLLHDLSDLFRATLAEPRSTIPLREEVELAKRYLDIEQLRFGPRMQVRWNIDPEVLSLPVPPLVLQPLVENAVKHGVEPSETPAHIRISLHRRGKNYATLTVTNTQAGPSAPGLGMALANVRHRLQLLYDMDFKMEQRHKAHAFQVQLRLPFNRTPAVPTAHAHPDH